jgi:pimeloyl-ACP methyl ester carboxylesterase
MLAMIAAEDLFDVEADLARIDAPTLVIGGTADAFYSEDLFRRTATGIPDGEAVLLEGKDHRHVAGSKGPASLALGFLLG